MVILILDYDYKLEIILAHFGTYNYVFFNGFGEGLSSNFYFNDLQEDFLQYIWKHIAFDSSLLKTTAKPKRETYITFVFKLKS